MSSATSKTKAFSSRFVEHFEHPSSSELLEEGSQISSLGIIQENTHSQFITVIEPSIGASFISKPDVVLTHSTSTNNAPTSPIPITISSSSSFSSSSELSKKQLRRHTQSTSLTPPPLLPGSSSSSEIRNVSELEEKYVTSQRITLKNNHSMPAYIHLVSQVDQTVPHPKPKSQLDRASIQSFQKVKSLVLKLAGPKLN